MKIIIIVELIINLILLNVYNLHMFQLNSYKTVKHFKWLKQNWKIITAQIISIIIALIMHYINNPVCEILCGIILLASVIFNVPKRKAKIPLHITNRVKRLIITELVLSLIILNNVSVYGILKCGILNIIAPILVVIANIVNIPVEKIIQKKFIKEAKEKLEEMPNLIVIGVTGSYGKTSVKNYLYKMLSTKYEVLVTPKNYNTTMGVVKTIREDLKPIHQVFICEMGATKPNDIKEICDIVKPTIGVITSVGPQHLDSFKTIENIVKTKFELADAVQANDGVMFLNFDNEYIRNNKVDMKYYTYGVENSELDYNSDNISASEKGLSFTFKNKDSKKYECKTKIIGKYNIANLTVAMGVSDYLETPINNILPIIKNMKNVEHRLELINMEKLNIIDDSYNSNPVSSKLAVETLGIFEGTKIIITPGLIELSEDEDKYNIELGEHIAKYCDYAFLVGEHSKSVLEGLKKAKFNEEKIFIVSSPTEAMGKIVNMKIEGTVNVLLENDLPDNYR